MSEQTEPRYQANVFLIAFAFWSLLQLVEHLDTTPQQATPDARLTLLIVLLILHCRSLLTSVVLFQRLGQATADRPCYPRPSFNQCLYFTATHLPVAYVLWLSHGRLWDFETVGLTMQMPWYISVAVGVAVVRVLNVIQSLAPSRQSGKTSYDAALIRAHLPRGSATQTLNSIHTALISPPFEDIVYRGFFVYYLGQLAGVSVGMIVGFILCVCLHLYQGPSRFVSCAAFFALSVALLYSPFGLLSVFSFHVAANTQYTLRMKTAAARYLIFLRSRRSDLHIADQ